MARDLADLSASIKKLRASGGRALKSSFALRDVTNRALPASCLLP